MAASGEVERALAVPGEGERAVAASGKRERALLRSLDYPCTRRLRLRRLLAYLRRFGHEVFFEVVNGWRPVVFRLMHLAELVEDGKWWEAHQYVLGFVDLGEMGDEAALLLQFLKNFNGVDEFAHGCTRSPTYLTTWFGSVSRDPVLTKYPCFSTIVYDFLTKRSDHTRAFVDFRLARRKAAKMVKELVRETPELKEKLRFPRGRNDLYHMLPIGSSFRRKRPLKCLGRKQSTELARFYLEMKKRLLSCQRVGPDFSARIQNGPAEPLIALFEKALEAGKRPVHKQVLETLRSDEGVPLMRTILPSSSPMINTLSSQGRRSGGQPVLMRRPEILDVHQATSSAHGRAPETGRKRGAQ